MRKACGGQETMAVPTRKTNFACWNRLSANITKTWHVHSHINGCWIVSVFILVWFLVPLTYEAFYLEQVGTVSLCNMWMLLAAQGRKHFIYYWVFAFFQDLLTLSRQVHVQHLADQTSAHRLRCGSDYQTSELHWNMWGLKAT